MIFVYCYTYIIRKRNFEFEINEKHSKIMVYTKIVFQTATYKFQSITIQIWYCLEKTFAAVLKSRKIFPMIWKTMKFSIIDNNFKNENWDEWSIKDSFSWLNPE